MFLKADENCPRPDLRLAQRGRRSKTGLARCVAACISGGRGGREAGIGAGMGGFFRDANGSRLCLAWLIWGGRVWASRAARRGSRLRHIAAGPATGRGRPNRQMRKKNGNRVFESRQVPTNPVRTCGWCDAGSGPAPGELLNRRPPCSWARGVGNGEIRQGHGPERGSFQGWRAYSSWFARHRRRGGSQAAWPAASPLAFQAGAVGGEQKSVRAWGDFSGVQMKAGFALHGWFGSGGFGRFGAEPGWSAGFLFAF